MKDATELLMRMIAHEIKYVNSMRHSLKEDELTILKTRSLEEEIEEHKQLIEEYRDYIKYIVEVIYTGLKLVPSTEHQMDTDLSTTNLEHQA